MSTTTQLCYRAPTRRRRSSFLQPCYRATLCQATGIRTGAHWTREGNEELAAIFVGLCVYSLHSLKFILDQRLMTIPQHTGVTKFFCYDLTVEYRPGKLSTVADALLRHDEEVPAACAFSAPSFELYDMLRTELRTDAQASTIRAKMVTDQGAEGWSEVDGMLLHKGRIFIPDVSSLWPVLLFHAHDTGHERVQKTLHWWRTSFFNAHALRQVCEFIRGCLTCKRNKSEHLHPAGFLQPLPVPSEVWSDVSVDFIEAFRKVGSKSVVLTVVYRFSKYAHFIPIGHPYSAASVARVFFDTIIRLHGIPCSIVSDRDTVFNNAFWRDLFRLAGVKLNMSSAFHP